MRYLSERYFIEMNSAVYNRQRKTARRKASRFIGMIGFVNCIAIHKSGVVLQIRFAV